MAQISARTWNIADWYKQSRHWIREEPADGTITMSPDTAKACEPNVYEITYTVGETPLNAGAHLSVEVSPEWKKDLGRIYPAKHLIMPGSGGSGYGAFVEAVSSRDDVKTDMAVSDASRFTLVDIAITEGSLKKGDWIKIILGGSEGSKIRAQKYAQRAIFTMGVDFDGEGVYKRVEPFPAVQVIGSWAAGLRIVSPATVDANRPFEVAVMPIDSYNHNPASGYTGEVEFMPSSGSLQMPEKLKFEESPIVVLKDAKVTDKGVFRVTAVDRENALIGRSNPIASGFSDEGNIYFGDIHGQIYESIGTGTTEEYYDWGRDVERLDFCATANHYGGRYDATPDIWNIVVETSNRYYQPGKFVTFVSYEWAGRVGHRNVYYRGDKGNLYPGFEKESNSLEKLWELLDGGKILTIPHHCKYCGLTDWKLRNHEMQRLVEICSTWGISECGDGVHSVQHALAMGHRIGFIGGTDTHFGQPGHGSHGVNEGKGLAAVYAEDLTRESVFDALWNRHCYATNGDRILLNCKVNGLRMGEEVEISSPAGKSCRESRNIAVKAEGTAPIEKVEIVRNNEVVYTHAKKSLSAEFEWEDRGNLTQFAISPTYEGDVPFVFYYCRVTQENGQMAWSSPVWFLLDNK